MQQHILFIVSISRGILSSGCDVPNRRLLSNAYAFLRAVVFHFGSSKLFDNRRWVAPCSLFQFAIRQRPWSTVFLRSAR